MAHLNPEQLKKGVICASAGNHAQGVALSASKLGTRAVIVMPVTTPEVKVRSVAARGAEVVGISADDPEEHAAFCGEEGLTFPLLSDPGGQVSRRYGSWISPYSQRHTFLIDPQGQLRSRWVAVQPLRHSQEVLATLEQLQAVAPA
jgi:peroxiredoxin Q/BCP